MPTELHGTFYTVQEASQELGYSGISTIRQACIDGTLPAIKVGKMWLIEEKDVKAMARQEVKGQGNRGVARK